MATSTTSSSEISAGLFWSLKRFANFTPEELDVIASRFAKKTVQKNEALVHEGSICREFYYVYKGCVRSFFVDRTGSEKTRYIVFENQMGTTLNSFITQTPSAECLQALEETEVLAISHDGFYHLNTYMNNWKKLYQQILERAYTFQNKKIEALVTLSARQRYEKILAENPMIMQRVSNKVLASYLDMREETLSRLKSG